MLVKNVVFCHISCCFCCTQRENLRNTCRNLILENRNYVVGFRQSPCILSSFAQKNGFAPNVTIHLGCSKFIPPKYESLFHKSRKEIELPFMIKYSRLAVRISPIISKNKTQAKGFRMYIQAAWKSIEAIQIYLQKC